MYSMWNPSDDAEDLLLTFYYGNHQTYAYPLHLAGKGQAMVDVKQIASMAMPDSQGHVLPLSATEGRLVISAGNGAVKDHINVAIDNGIYNPSTATCGQGCETCNGCTGYDVSADPFYAFDNVAQQAYGQCTWKDGSLQDYTGSASWSSSNTNVITVQTKGQSKPGLTSPREAGSSSLSATFEAPVNMGQVCGTLPLPTCQETQASPQSPTTVKAYATLSVANQNLTIEKDNGSASIVVTVATQAAPSSLTATVNISAPANPSNISLGQGNTAGSHEYTIAGGSSDSSYSFPITTTGTNPNSGTLTYTVSLSLTGSSGNTYQVAGSPITVTVKTNP
jgi:hypothetical protein